MSQVKAHRIPFRLHPRVFAALGADLVTSDVVAIIELVKNSYDALATRVDVRFREYPGTHELVIEIEDDGTGMTLKEIKDIWAVVATPHRLLAPVNRKRRSRRVSGEKGLGRLSTARLGDMVELFTKADNDRCWKVNVDWKSLPRQKSLSRCGLEVTPEAACPFRTTGTLIRVSKLKSKWEKERFEDLADQLSRLISPFEEVSDFQIFLTLPGKEAVPSQVEVPDFLSRPPYLLKGKVSSSKFLRAHYTFSNGRRTSDIAKQLISDVSESTHIKSECGPFSFEIRAWDMDTGSMEELATSLQVGRRHVRDVIKNYKGISLYRDKILVLPKSEGAKDWLGLDLRRVSKLGSRLSTSQIVGYISISSKNNAGIKDTSDRERLVENEASKQFKLLLQKVVNVLQDERDRDKEEQSHREPPLKDLFANLSAGHLITDIRKLVSAGRSAREILPLVEDFGLQVQEAVTEIEKRFFYYSRVASLGLLAAIIVHEVRNQTVVIGRLLSSVETYVVAEPSAGQRIARELQLAVRAVHSLERMADRFSPLASRASRRSKTADLNQIITDCVEMRAKEIKNRSTQVEIKVGTAVKVNVDAGELTAIVINFLDNSLYWIGSVPKINRVIVFDAAILPTERIDVYVHDSGPGIDKGDEERIFWPGVTKKPEGLGMGLTVASELVSQHGGNTRLVVPGELGGASFAFDLPLFRESD